MSKTIRFEWRASAPGEGEPQVLFVQDGNILYPAFWTAGARRELDAWQKNAGFTGGTGEIVWPAGLKSPVILAGVGKRTDFHAARWLRVWAAIGRQLLQAKGVARAACAWPEKVWSAQELAELAGLATEGLLQGAYSFDAYKSKARPRKFIFTWCGELAGGTSVRAAVRRAEIIGATLNDIRAIANLPANDLGPQDLARHAQKLARANGLQCRVWSQAALEKEKCGAFLSVARGSRRPGCLIRLAYPGKRGRKPLVIVGKAVMFDTGGISLKPPKGMEWMKFDKGGGMAALAVALLAARLKLPRPLIVYIPAIENMPGGGAARPGDIVTARNGKTVEILTTDAEGRMILADALSFAADEKPAAIVDIATLTGAAIVALGHEATAVMGNQDRLVMELMLAGETTGERLWQLPLWSEYDDLLKGKFADWQNVGDGSAGTITGGAFLRQFVPEEIPWAHLDIAGTAWLEAEKPFGGPGATLVPARLLAEWVARTTL
ncbi:MAG: leucyl aminopeptidase [Kiritimatiellia bacterium]|jgi:leucyl aminopeptidase